MRPDISQEYYARLRIEVELQVCYAGMALEVYVRISKGQSDPCIRQIRYNFIRMKVKVSERQKSGDVKLMWK